MKAQLTRGTPVQMTAEVVLIFAFELIVLNSLVKLAF